MDLPNSDESSPLSVQLCLPRRTIYFITTFLSNAYLCGARLIDDSCIWVAATCLVLHGTVTILVRP